MKKIRPPAVRQKDVRLGSGQHLGAAVAIGPRQRAWIVTWHAAAGADAAISDCRLTCCKGADVSHSKPGSGHWSHLSKKPATPGPHLRYICVLISIGR